MSFKDLMDTKITIGKKDSGIDPVTRDPVENWEILYEAKATIQTLSRPRETSAEGKTNYVLVDKIYTPVEDVDGKEMELDETMEAVAKVPYNPDEDDVVKYKFERVYKPRGHHYEINTVKVIPSG